MSGRVGPPPVGCIVLLAVLVLVPLGWSLVHDVGTGQWVARIPAYLMALGALSSLTVLSWQRTHRPSPVGFVLPAVLLLGALVWNSFRDGGTSQWVRGIPDGLVILGGLAILMVLSWQTTHRPE